VRTDHEIDMLIGKRVRFMRRVLLFRRLMIGGMAVLGMVLTGLTAVLIGSVSTAQPPDAPARSASLLLEEAAAGGYVLTAIIAFTLGVIVTWLCMKKRERMK